MKSSNHRLIPLTEAIQTYHLENIFGDDFEELVIDAIDEDAKVLVFQGDTICNGDFDQSRGANFNASFDFGHIRLVIVEGNLTARNIEMQVAGMLIVLGDVTCEKILLKEFYPLYVKGNLIAKQAVLGIASQEGPFLGHEKFGSMYARIQGTVSSPRVQTWFMPLNHLNWTSDSGAEYAEDMEDPQKNNWFDDPIWKL